MADPVVIDITPADTWQKVATNVVSGFVYALGGPVKYNYTYRDTGNAPPTDKNEGVSFSDDGVIAISSSAGIDVYIMSLGAVGKVRVDL